MRAKPQTIDEYLAGVSPEQQAALQRLRRLIQAAAPKAEEGISYGLAAFRLDGKPLVAFGASTNHCAFYPMSSTTIDALKDKLKGYATSKGTIRFPADRPLPASLVRTLVKARIAENAALAESKPVPKTRKRAPARGASTQTDPAVATFLTELDHPLKPAIEAVRRIILSVSPEIREGIKWNAPSFRTTEFFATLNLRAKNGTERVWLILHTGAKGNTAGSLEPQVPDPAGLLKWLAKDRCLVTFAGLKDVHAKRAALGKIIRAWIKSL